MSRQPQPHRLVSQATMHLQAQGFRASTDEDWAGGFRGVGVQLEGGHRVSLSPPQEGSHVWGARIERHPDDPHHEQDGLRLGAPPEGGRLPHAQPRPGGRTRAFGDDYHHTTFVAHPRDVPDRVREMLEHPQVRTALAHDARRQRAGLPTDFTEPTAPHDVSSLFNDRRQVPPSVGRYRNRKLRGK